jgi:hypothetical protein
MLRHQKWTSQDRLNERAEEINDICDDINHINEIYTDLAVIVHSQKDNIDNIEKNADDAKKKTEKGVEHLLQAEKYQKSGLKIIIAGAIVGAAVGGPIGLAAGLKLWSIGTATAGFFLGGVVGKVID